MTKTAFGSIVLATTAMLLLCAPAVDASSGVPLKGAFNFTETVLSSSSEYNESPYKAKGSVIHSVYRFTPGRSSACPICKKDQVRMDRAGGGYSPWYAILKIKSPKLYKGLGERVREFPNVNCAGEGEDAGREEAEVTLRVVATAHGKVTKVKGTIKSVFPQKSLCKHSRETVKFTGIRS